MKAVNTLTHTCCCFVIMKTHGFRDEQPHANFCYITGTSVIEAVSNTHPHPPPIDIYTKPVSFRAHAQPLRKHTSDSETHQIAFAINNYLIYNVCMIVVLPCVIGKHIRSIHNYTAVAVTRGRLRKRTQYY